MEEKIRIDKMLVELGLAPTRSKAQALILNGKVKCNNVIVCKESFKVCKLDNFEILENDELKYVSRGGLKLEKAITEFHVDFKDKKVIDIGSSTGGFTDCALQHGASSVICVDVGNNLLDKKLQKDVRVKLYENQNIKDFNSEYFKEVDIITIDVSFVSVIHVLTKIFQEGVKVDVVALIKPQFECGRAVASKYRGVIRDKKIHLQILESVFKVVGDLGFKVLGLDSSPIRGGDGNVEYIAYLSNKDGVKSISVNFKNLVKNAFEN